MEKINNHESHRMDTKKILKNTVSKLLPYNINNLKVYAFVGPSGTGKSYRAQQVAFDNNIDAIIDDGLLISGSRVLAGKSAKKASTKIQTIRKALFMEEEEQKNIQNAIKKEKLESLLILGTSDGMIEKIVGNLKLPKIQKTIYIQDVATEEEMEAALKTRKKQGKHIVPVPTFEIKKDFSGILLDPMQIFRLQKNKKPYLSEKSIIRPTFSYLGQYTIKDKAFRDLVRIIAKNDIAISGVNKVQITKTQLDDEERMDISMELVIFYGYKILDVVNRFKNNLEREFEKATSVNNIYVEIKVQDIEIDKKKKEEKENYINLRDSIL